jgi:hypothetical protein
VNQTDPTGCAHVMQLQRSPSYCGQPCKDADNKEPDIASPRGHQGGAAHINSSAAGFEVYAS